MITKTLRGGYVAMVDDQDAALLLSQNWQPRKRMLADGRVIVYVARSIGAQRKSVYLHHLIIGNPSTGSQVDHMDGNALNNCRSNLRMATVSQNQCAQRMRSDNTSGYKGVSFDKETRRWRASIKVRGIRIKLGRFDSAEEAAKAYQQKAVQEFGDFAIRNPLTLNSPNAEKLSFE